MHREEEQSQRSCADCGAQIEPATDRAFSFGRAVLCFKCAVRRGGSYDERHDRWLSDPEVSDLDTGMPG
jgi:hypothetical protein